jgi:MoxR-like ATPase
VLYEVKRVVVGQDAFLERILVAILAPGHLLIEGVPGLAKTLTVNTLAQAVRGSFKRIQFTPDLLPADLVGTRIYNQKSGEFSALGERFDHAKRRIRTDQTIQRRLDERARMNDQDLDLHY